MTNPVEHQHEPTPMRDLTRTQQTALRWMREHPANAQWPSMTGRHAPPPSSSARWSERTLQGLVDAGYAVWRGSVFETPYRHGVMPHILLLDRAASRSRQHYIETGEYMTASEVAEWDAAEHRQMGVS